MTGWTGRNQYEGRPLLERLGFSSPPILKFIIIKGLGNESGATQPNAI